MAEQPGGGRRRKRLPGPPGSGPEMRPWTVTRRPRATVRNRCSRAAPGIRPEALRPPATGSLTDEGLRPFRALRRDHPTWGLASGCGERTRPETKSAAPVAAKTPHDEVRSFVRKGRAERRKACASSPMRVRAFPARTNHDVAPSALRRPSCVPKRREGPEETAGDPRAVNNRGASACLRVGKGCVRDKTAAACGKGPCAPVPARGTRRCT